MTQSAATAASRPKRLTAVVACRAETGVTGVVAAGGTIGVGGGVIGTDEDMAVAAGQGSEGDAMLAPTPATSTIRTPP